jgi:phosphoglycolate phosphatase
MVRSLAVFDLDGTLLDSVSLCTDILNAMLDDRGSARRVSCDEARPHVTAGGRAMVAALLGAACGDADAAVAEFRARYASMPTPPDSLFPGVREGLAALRAAGTDLAIWSNKPQALCDKVVADLALAGLFAAVVGTSAHVPLKPDPIGFDRALALAGGTRPHACFVGDSEADYAAARAVGVPVIMATWGYGEPGAAWAGACRVDAFHEIPPIVARLLSKPAAA